MESRLPEQTLRSGVHQARRLKRYIAPDLPRVKGIIKNTVEIRGYTLWNPSLRVDNHLVGNVGGATGANLPRLAGSGYVPEKDHVIAVLEVGAVPARTTRHETGAYLLRRRRRRL